MPSQIRTKRPLDIPVARSEHQLLRDLKKISAQKLEQEKSDQNQPGRRLRGGIHALILVHKINHVNLLFIIFIHLANPTMETCS